MGAYQYEEMSDADVHARSMRLRQNLLNGNGSNRFDAPCTLCGTSVRKRHGLVHKNQKTGKWIVRCVDCLYPS